MKPRCWSLTAPVLCLLLAGCSGVTGGGGSSSSSQNVITRADIEEQHFSNAYEMVNALRPHWIQSRSASFGASGRQGVVIYLDNNRLGGPDLLRQLPAAQIESARFMSGPEATSRYGTNHADGAIIVTSRRQ